MKKKFLALAVFSSLSLSLSPAYAHAVTETEAEKEPTTSVTTTSVEDEETKKKERSSRVEAYKKNLKETLSAAVKTRIAGRCVAAQAILKAKTRNNSVITEKRDKVYDKIVARLEALSANASDDGVDVTALNANIAELKNKIATFTVANEAYQDALSDLETIECESDPTAFKAALEATRSAQATVRNAAKEIRTYLSGTVKPTLQAIKTAAGSEE